MSKQIAIDIKNQLLTNNVINEDGIEQCYELQVYQINDEFEIKINDIDVNEICIDEFCDINVVDKNGIEYELSSFEPDERLLLLNYTKK
jgi:hypothetical protein